MELSPLLVNPVSIQAINTTKAPLPVGPYNQAIVAGDWVYCSGQISLDPISGKMISDDSIETETYQVLTNLRAVLESAGVTTDQVVRTTIFLTNLEDFAKVNTVYGEFFNKGLYPARACVEVKALPKNARVEIDCIAFLR
ncbi:putative translation initiation inhibitor (chromatophore) [Paulinella micropora]|uniref:Translation initiation inhibitor n=1 Tax=Paulinella micropora TaxID=1928728 RepID=A0A1L5YD80_9EUKA|nr:hypothetical protein PCKR_905 [Paulinella micropora]AQX45432.1 hypothetical protein PFK_905 [Paulinella micropora]BBL86652.1 putative translation initiation inhibitor [Paulinella micropora]